MDRLLTDIEMTNIMKDCWANTIPLGNTDLEKYANLSRALVFESIQAQDAKTLKTVGKWLESKMFAVPLAGVEWHIRLDEVESLKRGEMPDETS